MSGRYVGTPLLDRILDRLDADHMTRFTVLNSLLNNLIRCLHTSSSFVYAELDIDESRQVIPLVPFLLETLPILPVVSPYPRDAQRAVPSAEVASQGHSMRSLGSDKGRDRALREQFLTPSPRECTSPSSLPSVRWKRHESVMNSAMNSMGRGPKRCPTEV
jgi:hypothetical protein